MEFEAEDEMRVLPCRHAEHAECMDQWLTINKACPLCQAEVTCVACPPAADVSAALEAVPEAASPMHAQMDVVMSSSPTVTSSA